MKALSKNLFLAVLTLTLSNVGFAAPIQKAKVNLSNLKTSHNFNDKLVDGKYQHPFEASAKVDNEKLLDDLIGVRKNFKDRMQDSAERE